MLEYIPEDIFFDFARDVSPRLLGAGERFVGYKDTSTGRSLGRGRRVSGGLHRRPRLRRLAGETIRGGALIRRTANLKL
ncbi:MAG TPA: hypothetical protein VEY13_03905 [Rubrobacteraceae bacterium]|nr:hypothetical protein [Rubrobacteraceae bacterium]